MKRRQKRTLLDSQKALTSRVRSAIAAAKDKGIKVVLASGRPFEGMLPTLKELGLDSADDYVLTYNASLILKVACKSVVNSAILTGKDAIELSQNRWPIRWVLIILNKMW